MGVIRGESTGRRRARPAPPPTSSTAPSDASDDEALVGPVRLEPSVAPRVFGNNERRNFDGGNRHLLRLKRGRRSRHRYQNELQLLDALQEEDEEDFFRVDMRTHLDHFSILSDNEKVMEAFLQQQVTLQEMDDEDHTRILEDDDDDEGGAEAFLRISQNLRSVLKRHLPMGMMEGLEGEIRSFFESRPKAKLVKTNLSSYERLLAHACSAYYRLHSKSFDDEDGARVLRIDNTHGAFRVLQTSLSQHLQQMTQCR